MIEESTEAIKVAVQWLFAPLLAVAVLAWLSLRVLAYRVRIFGMEVLV